MSHSIPDEASNEELVHNAENDLIQLPELPPGMFIAAPGSHPHRQTRWPDAIDVIFEKDPACCNIFEALLYQSLWAIIDHGAGVVIGETTVIGDNVMLYHQVTLGATGWWRRSPGRMQKRHPTIEDDVTIGVGAAILGPITIGRSSKIGAMALVFESVPPNSVVASKPAELLVKGGEALEKHQELTQGWSSNDSWEMDYQI